MFGRYTGKTAAGLNTNWPWPIGSVIKVPVWDQQITEVGYRSERTPTSRRRARC